MVAIVLLLLLPLCSLLKNEESIAQTSVVSVVLMCGFTAATLCLAAYRGTRRIRPPLLLWRPGGATLSLPVLVFGFTGHSSLFPCVAKMRQPTVERTMRLLRRTMLCAAIIYGCVGVGGYRLFGERTAGNILRNFSEVGTMRGPVAFAVRHMKLVFALSVAGAVPVTMLPISELIISLLLPAPAAPVPPLLRLAVNASLLGVTLLFALLLPNVELVFALAGSTGAVMQAYIFPAAAFLAAQEKCRCEAPAESGGGDGEAGGQEEAGGQKANVGDLWFRQQVEDTAAATVANSDMAAQVEASLFGPLRGRPARVLSYWLLFGGVGGMWVCTSSALRAVQEEATVVQLAQRIATLEEEVLAGGGARTAANGTALPPPPPPPTPTQHTPPRLNFTELSDPSVVNASQLWTVDAAAPLLLRAKELAAELEEQERVRVALPAVS